MNFLIFLFTFHFLLGTRGKNILPSPAVLLLCRHGNRSYLDYYAEKEIITDCSYTNQTIVDEYFQIEASQQSQNKQEVEQIGICTSFINERPIEFFLYNRNFFRLSTYGSTCQISDIIKNRHKSSPTINTGQCKEGQLTNTGINEAISLGAKFQQRYDFSSDDLNNAFIRSTLVERVIETAMSVIYGIEITKGAFLKTPSYIHIDTRAPSDSLLGKKLTNELLKAAFAECLFKVVQKLFLFQQNSDISIGGYFNLEQHFDRVKDPRPLNEKEMFLFRSSIISFLERITYLDKPLKFELGLSNDQEKEINALITKLYYGLNYLPLIATEVNAPTKIIETLGLILNFQQLYSDLRTFFSSDKILSMNFAHDCTITPFLFLFDNLEVREWVPFLANFVFEVYRLPNHGIFLAIVYNFHENHKYLSVRGLKSKEEDLTKNFELPSDIRLYALEDLDELFLYGKEYTFTTATKS